MNAEPCHREGCDAWVTGASDYCSSECEEIARVYTQTISRFGEHAANMADAMDRLRAEARAATEAYENYRRTVMEGMRQ